MFEEIIEKNIWINFNEKLMYDWVIVLKNKKNPWTLNENSIVVQVTEIFKTC